MAFMTTNVIIQEPKPGVNPFVAIPLGRPARSLAVLFIIAKAQAFLILRWGDDG